MLDKESRDETGDIDFRSSSDEIFLAGEDLECAKGNISLLFVSASGLFGEEKSSLLSNDSEEENEENESVNINFS